ncbi:MULTISPECIES: hypothetical protein [Pasteurellaceae]|uniref:hypothetical protein n=1 Tax=Pasteurellaceae TaxID=712 RepID=UPI0027667B65|nr:hypothetical protein [Pasteurella atlantica]MDP8100346.1 hypothetical protein [Pasteurella atlantica]
MNKYITNGYFDILVKNKITNRMWYQDKKKDKCEEKTQIDFKNSVVKFVQGIYQ